MIQLEVENYCNNCPMFQCDMDQDILYVGLDEEVMTRIFCKNKESCSRIVEYLRKELKQK